MIHGPTPAAVYVKRFAPTGLTVAVAESLTGGLLASTFAAMDGASEFFLGGVVAYASEVKFQVLGVTPGPVMNQRTVIASAPVCELDAEANSYEKAITVVVREWRPELLSRRGIGPIVAATVVCAWSHSGRFRSEAVFASLAGVSPIPASSAMTVRHRLNRRGDQLNAAFHTIVINRIRSNQATHIYVERRRAEGKTDREIKRCLKRYVARQIFRQFESLNMT